MTINAIISIVAGETFVGGGMLKDDSNFMELVHQGVDIKALIAYVNENY